MDIHQNARLTPFSREALAQIVLAQQVSLNSAAAEFKVSAKTAAKWVRRYQREGRSGLRDRSSCPQHSPPLLPSRPGGSGGDVTSPALGWSPHRLATGLSRATVSRILRRLRLSRIRDLEAAPPVIRYEHPQPGDLLHLDIKKIGRFQAVGCRITGNHRGRIHRASWEYVSCPSMNTPASPSLRSTCGGSIGCSDPGRSD
jgi:transposase-like protein